MIKPENNQMEAIMDMYPFGEFAIKKYRYNK